MFYIEDYKELIIGQEYLFINVSGDYVGKPFKGSGVYAMLRRLERKTGIKASPHMLRHYFANARRKDGWKLEMISQALGHRNIETTMKYLNITEDELQMAVISSKPMTIGIRWPPNFMMRMFLYRQSEII